FHGAIWREATRAGGRLGQLHHFGERCIRDVLTLRRDYTRRSPDAERLSEEQPVIGVAESSARGDVTVPCYDALWSVATKRECSFARSGRPDGVAGRRQRQPPVTADGERRRRRKWHRGEGQT